VALSGNFRVDVRPYSGFTNPSLPVAAWIAQGSIVGDASGGNVTMNFFVLIDGDPQTSLLYNLEQIAFDASSETVLDVILSTRNMDTLAPNRPVFDRRWQFQTVAASNLSFTALPLDKASMLPLWLGAPNRDEGDAGLRVQYKNTDLQQFLITMQGYMWGPRSVLNEGGPRRPQGGLFGE